MPRSVTAGTSVVSLSRAVFAGEAIGAAAAGHVVPRGLITIAAQLNQE